MSDVPETRQVTIDEAAALLGLSRRTVERRLTQGRLQGRKVGARWLVDVPLPRQEPEPDPTEMLRHDRDELARQVTGLNHRVELLTSQLDAVLSERDYLRQAHAAALTISQRLLPERAASTSEASTTEPPPRRSWWFWKR